nr:hypothetical protein FAC6B23_02 [Penicillium fuscum]
MSDNHHPGEVELIQLTPPPTIDQYHKNDDTERQRLETRTWSANSTEKTIPPSTLGHKVIPFGPWATLLMTTPFSVAIEGGLMKSELFISLRSTPAKQELVLRFERRLVKTGLTLIQEINQSITNVEAAQFEVVGTVKVGAAKCFHCQSSTGPFAHCVTAPGAAACGNRHWKKQEHRCSFNDLDPQKSSGLRQAISQHVVNNVPVTKAEALTLLQKIQKLKKNLRGIDQWTASVIDRTPEATESVSPEQHDQRMEDYFRLLRFSFLNTLCSRLRQADRGPAEIEHIARNIIKAIDNLTI